MLSVSHVVSNVKGRREHDLAPCVLIVGDNGAGKSAILDSLSLAVCGEPLTESIGKKPNDILLLKPEGDTRLVSRVTLSDGTEASWSCAGSSARASKPEWRHPGGEGGLATFLLDEARALIKQQPQALRASLVARLGLELPADQATAMIPEAHRPLLEAATGLSMGRTWSGDEMLDAYAALGKAQRAASAEVKTYQEAGQTDVEPLSEAESEELARLTAQSAQRGVSAESIESTRTALASAENELALLEAQEASREALDPATAAADRGTLAALGAVRHAQTWALTRLRSVGHAVRCPCCGREETAEAMLLAHGERLTAAEEHLRARLGAFDQSQLVATRRKSISERVRTLRTELSTATLALPVDLGRLASLRQRQQVTDARAQATIMLAGAEQRVEALKALKRTWETLLARILDEPVEALSRAITAALPGHMARVLLRDGTRQVCRIEMNGRDWRALSGAERALLLSALSGAVIPQGAPPLRVLVIDDVWMSRGVLDALLESLRDAMRSAQHGASQIIVCAVEYDGQPPEGWLRIEA